MFLQSNNRIGEVSYAPPIDSPSSSDTPTSELGKEDVIELLGDDSEETEEPLELDTKRGDKKSEETTEDKEPSEDEEIDELEEIEQELKGPKEEDLELVTPVRRKEILAKYPTIFKDFPYLEKAYYRDQQFTELLPTINDAKIAVQKAQTMDFMERTVMGGDLRPILNAAKQENPESLNMIADNYLQSLRDVDQQTYFHVLGNVVKDTIITMVREGKAMGDAGQPLTAAANILNQFIFGSNNFQAPTKLAKQNVNPEQNGREQELQKREQQIVMNQFTGVRDDLQTQADNKITATIDAHIDPRGSMSDYVKSKATQDAFDTLQNLMDRDTRFHSILDKLWERSAREGFSRESADRIKAAYLSRAKTLLPAVIKKARAEAMRGSNGSRVSSVEKNGLDSDEVEAPTKKGPISGTKSPTNPSGKIRSAKDIPKGMRSIDFLMRD